MKIPVLDKLQQLINEDQERKSAGIVASPAVQLLESNHNYPETNEWMLWDWHIERMRAIYPESETNWYVDGHNWSVVIGHIRRDFNEDPFYTWEDGPQAFNSTESFITALRSSDYNDYEWHPELRF